MPFWAAQTNLRALAKQFPDYTYKEAALNPTNPADKATDWEAASSTEFASKPALTTRISTRDTPDGPDPVDLAADPHHRQELPDLPFHAERGARIDDRPLRHRQWFRLEARRRASARRSCPCR